MTTCTNLQEFLGMTAQEKAKITMLDIADTMGPEGAVALATALPQATHLTTLNLCGNRIEDEGVVALAAVLPQATLLTTLNLGSNKIGNEGAVALATALPQATHLTTLDLGHNNIGPDGAVALAAALPQATHLTTLNLQSNHIGDGVVALAAALPQVTHLTTLDLCYNNIGPDGAVALATALPQVTYLTTLDLCLNKIGNEGAVALATALPQATHLTTLDFRYNNIGPENNTTIKDLLNHNKMMFNSVLKTIKSIIEDDNSLPINNTHLEYYRKHPDAFKAILKKENASLDTTFNSWIEKLDKIALEHLNKHMDAINKNPDYLGSLDEDTLNIISSFLTIEDYASVIVVKKSDQASLNLPDGAGGGEITREERVDETATDEYLRNKEEAEVDTAIDQDLEDMIRDINAAAEQDEFVSDLTGNSGEAASEH